MKRITFSKIVAFVLLFTVIQSTLAIAPVTAAGGVFDVTNLKFNKIFEDKFDSKTKDDIYKDWKGVHNLAGYENPVEDGKLKAAWQPDQSVGYAFKTPYTNAKYDFDLTVAPIGSSFHSVIALRTTDHAGMFFNGINESFNGIGFFAYNNGAPDKILLAVADANGEVTNAIYPFNFPAGVDFSAKAKMTIYDLDSKILYYINDKPFVAICFDNLSGDYYTSGKVYDASEKEVGNFTDKKVRRFSNFGIAERTTDTYIDNFVISEVIDNAKLAEKEKKDKEIFEATEVFTMVVGSPKITYKKGSTIDKEIVIDVAPVIYNGRTLVPLRGLLEAMGAKVEWFPNTEDITITKGDMVLSMRIEEDRYYKYTTTNLEDIRFNFDVKPKIINNRTMVPIRLISEQLGYNVAWDVQTKKITIKTSFENKTVSDTQYDM